MAWMSAAGAPASYLVVNGAALAIGLALLALIPGRHHGARGHGVAVLGAGVALLAAALLGTSVDGITRWVRLGPIILQPALILLPAMLIGHARSPDRWGSIGLAVAALALAWQPDRAMAAVLVAGVIAPAALYRRRLPILALGTAIAGLLVTLTRPDGLAPTPFVEQVLADAFAFSPLAGTALVAAAVLLLLPALIGQPAGAAFAAVWLTVLLASVLGPYPTPLIGFGGSGVIGYLLALAALPSATEAARRSERGARGERTDRLGDPIVQAG